RVVHFDRPGTLTVNDDVVRATSDLASDCFMCHLQGCHHLRSPLLGLGLIGQPGHAAGWGRLIMSGAIEGRSQPRVGLLTDVLVADDHPEPTRRRLLALLP